MTLNAYKQLIANSSESTKRRNADALAPGLRSIEHKSNGGTPLEHRKGRPKQSKDGPLYCVTLFCLCQNFPDSDGKIHGYKGLRDAIADWLGVDDGDSWIRWEYVPPIHSAQTGTLVKIEKL